MAQPKKKRFSRIRKLFSKFSGPNGVPYQLFSLLILWGITQVLDFANSSALYGYGFLFFSAIVTLIFFGFDLQETNNVNKEAARNLMREMVFYGIIIGTQLQYIPLWEARAFVDETQLYKLVWMLGVYFYFQTAIDTVLELRSKAVVGDSVGISGD